MSDVPQYVVGYLGESGSGKGWRVAICGTQRGSSYSHSRHKVSLHNHPAKDRASVGLSREQSEVWQEACLAREVRREL